MHCMYVLLISKCADCVFLSKFGFMILVKFTFYKICNFTFNLQRDESTAIVKRYRNASFNLDTNHRILSHTERFTLYWTEWITHTHTHTCTREQTCIRARESLCSSASVSGLCRYHWHASASGDTEKRTMETFITSTLLTLALLHTVYTPQTLSHNALHTTHTSPPAHCLYTTDSIPQCTAHYSH